MSQEVSSYALYLVLNKIFSCEPGIFEIINTIVFYNIFDINNPLNYKEQVDFLLIQNISVRDMAYFLIEYKKCFKNLISNENKNLSCYTFSNLDDGINTYIKNRREFECNKVDYLLDSQQLLSNRSFNILLYLYKPLFISQKVDINFQINEKYFKFIFTNLNMTKNEVSYTTPCTRCGCSKRFDDFRDRICYCDTCKENCYNHIKIFPKRKMKKDNEKKNYELCKMSLMIKKLGKKIKDIISQNLMLSFHKIPKNLYLVLKDKNINITDICDFIIEWKNFKKSNCIFNYQNFLEKYPDIDKQNTIKYIITLEVSKINKLYDEFRNNFYYIADSIDVNYYNFLSIKSINIMTLLFCNCFTIDFCYTLYNNILTRNNITLKDIYIIDKLRISTDYKSLLNKFPIYNNCSCIDCDCNSNYNYKLELLIYFCSKK